MVCLTFSYDWLNVLISQMWMTVFRIAAEMVESAKMASIVTVVRVLPATLGIGVGQVRFISTRTWNNFIILVLSNNSS